MQDRPCSYVTPYRTFSYAQLGALFAQHGRLVKRCKSLFVKSMSKSFSSSRSASARLENHSITAFRYRDIATKGRLQLQIYKTTKLGKVSKINDIL